MIFVQTILRIELRTFDLLTGILNINNQKFLTGKIVIMIGLHFIGQNPTVRDQCVLLVY
jgi:hypothetical protein